MQVILYCFCLIFELNFELNNNNNINWVPPINLGNKPQEEEEMLRDSLVLVDPFTEEQELHLREAAIELNFNWRKIKKSKKYADIFFEFTSEMLEVKYFS